MPYTTPTLRAGALAFFDTFSGLVPCRVDRIDGAPVLGEPASSAHVVYFTLTAARKAYRRGEHLSAGSLCIVPRAAIRGGRTTPYRILPYRVEGTS